MIRWRPVVYFSQILYHAELSRREAGGLLTSLPIQQKSDSETATRVLHKMILDVVVTRVLIGLALLSTLYSL